MAKLVAVSFIAFIAKNQLWITAALLPILIFPYRFPFWVWNLAIILMAVPWAARCFTRNRTSSFELLVLLFLLWHLPSFYATVDPRASLEKYSQTLAGVGIACGLIAKERTAAQLKRLIFLAVFGTGAIAVITPVITDWTWPAKLIPVIPALLLRSQSWKVAEYVNPNVLGGMMVLVFPLALGLWMVNITDFSTAPRVTRAAVAAAILAIGGMLALSQARGGYIGTAAALLVFAYLLGGKWRWAVAGGLYATLAGILWIDVGNLKELLAGSSLVSSWEVRAELWSRALYMIQDFSFTGVGLGMYSKVANVLYPFFLISPDTDVGHAHNLLLQVTVDLGIPGLVVYCALLAHAISRPLPALPDSPLERTLRIGAHCALLAMLVHGLLDAAQWSNKLAVAPWFVLGLLETSPPPTAKPWLRRWEIAVWWVLLSLLAISFVGDHPYIALAIAIAGGAALGTLASRHP